MSEAKDIDDSLEFLRYFEKYTESEDLLSVVQHKMEQNSRSLDLIRQNLSEDDCRLLADLAPLSQLKVLNLRETGLTSAGLQHLCMSPHLTGLDEFIIGVFDGTETREEVQAAAFKATESRIFPFLDRWINIAAIRAMGHEGRLGTPFLPILEEQAQDPWSDQLLSEARGALQKIRGS